MPSDSPGAASSPADAAASRPAAAAGGRCRRPRARRQRGRRDGPDAGGAPQEAVVLLGDVPVEVSDGPPAGAVTRNAVACVVGARPVAVHGAGVRGGRGGGGGVGTADAMAPASNAAPSAATG